MKLFNIQKLLIGLFFAALLTACDENSSKKAGEALGKAVSNTLGEIVFNVIEGVIINTICSSEAGQSVGKELEALGLSKDIISAARQNKALEEGFPTDCKAKKSSIPEATKQKCISLSMKLICEDGAGRLADKSAEEKSSIAEQCRSLIYSIKPRIAKCVDDEWKKSAEERKKKEQEEGSE